jgi:hypothetical protein
MPAATVNRTENEQVHDKGTDNATFSRLCDVKFAETPPRRLTDGVSVVWRGDAPLSLPEAEETHPAALYGGVFPRRRLAGSHAGSARAKL